MTLNSEEGEMQYERERWLIGMTDEEYFAYFDREVARARRTQ